MQHRLALLLIVSLTCAACECEVPPPANQAAVGVTPSAQVPSQPLAAGQGRTLHVFDVEGMTCQACQSTVYEAASGVPGVQQASVSLEQNKAWVVADATDGPAPASIAQAIQDAGYEAQPQDVVE